MEQHEGEARFSYRLPDLGQVSGGLAVRTDKSIDAWPRPPLLTTVKHGASGRCYARHRRGHAGRCASITRTRHDRAWGYFRIWSYADRYAWPGESLRIDTYRRVAIALAAREADQEQTALFLENFLAGAIGAGRIMANAGAADGDGDGGATMVNCFVQPAIDPGLGWPQGLDAALARAVRTMSMGGGVGYDFSPVPPADSGAGRGGACAVIDRYDQACQAWPRRPGAGGRAQMGVLACDHPDLPAFLHAKAGRRRWPT